MSTLDRIRELDKERQKLIEDAKREALDRANQAIKDLNELGFHYQLVQGDTPKPTRTRRSGVRDAVLQEIKKHPEGISRQNLMTALDADDDDKRQQSISNAVAALKKSGQITGDSGHYQAT